MRAGTVVIVVGIVVVLIGVAMRFGLLSWFGNLPGDLRWETESTTAFIPLTSMLVVSVGGSLVVNLLIRLFRD
jgi:hypothetical protein